MDDDIYEAVNALLADGAQTGREVRTVDNKHFLFRTKLDHFGGALCAYAFANETDFDHMALGLYYEKDVEGTPLEQKLIAALDEAASSYQELTSE